MSQKDSISWEDKTYQEALDSISSGCAQDCYDSLDSIDEQEITGSFKTALADYKRLFKRCEKEGVEVSDELDSYKDEYYDSSPSISKRLEIIAELKEQIVTMISSCERPPKDIMKKYSEDLVSRIENGVIDGFEISED
jgi:hypothetical protein